MISKFKDFPKKALFYTQNLMYIVAPSHALSGYIAKYTITFANDNFVSDSLTLFPDASGCLIFTLGGSTLTSLLWGTTTKTFIVNNDLNAYPMRLFIELLPGGLFYLTGIKQSALSNQQIPLWQVDSQLHSLISDAFESAENLSSLIDRLNSILLSYIQKRALPQVLLSALEHINLYKGCLSVKELSRLESYSDRHLNRLFNDYIGTSVKTFSSIIRINHLLQTPNNGKRLLADIAQTSGFYDQAHFNHTFKSICGVTPKEYFENMSEFYNESIRL